MKKILFLISFLVLILFSFPLTGRAVAYELTASITSVKIPERSGMILATDKPDTEFSLTNGYLALLDKNGAVVTSVGGSIDKNLANKKLLFSYDASLAPYRIYAAVTATITNRNYTPPLIYGDRDFTASCSQISGSYYYVGLGYFAPDSNSATGNPRCPNAPPYCSYSGCYYTGSDLAFPPTDITHYSAPSPITGDYWLSPSLFCLDAENPALCP